MKIGLVIAAVVSLGGLALAQQGPDPGTFSSDLIAWSYMQAPQQPEHRPGEQQPTPEPNPETQPTQNPTPVQPPSTSPSQNTTESQNATAQTFIGIVGKDNDDFVLKVSEATSYKLDNQQQVQQYQGQRVRVTGILNRSINLIHVDRIEPLS
jgi:Protein of unknown function (DUF5818)